MQRLRFALAFVPSALAILAWPATAAPPSLSEVDDRDCHPVCAATCLKPLVIPDRWDDVTVIPGHADWSRNARYDLEAFTDGNVNRLYDVGEPFVDGNANGSYDAEAYHPLLTGYIPGPLPGNLLAGPEGDLGRLLRLRPSREERVVASNYFAVSFAPPGGGAPRRGARAYREALEFCLGSLHELGDEFELEPGSMPGPTYEALKAVYERDAQAAWDPVSKSVVGSAYPPLSGGRIVLLALSDPRIVPESGRSSIVAVKFAAFFFEAPTADGAVSGRFLKVQSPSIPCDCDCQSAETFLRDCR